MNRDDAVTFSLAIVAALLTFLVVSRSHLEGPSSIALAFVVFGAFLFVKSFTDTLRE
ncbi:hypothetical protein [Haladaptatus sp. NG-SE-30]